MAELTGISWTDHTFNPWWGCAKVSPACDHCYAERDAGRFAAGQVLWGVDAHRRTFGDKHWNEPLRWNAAAAKAGVRRRVFCASMADVFDKNAPDGARDRLWRLIVETPSLDWLLLTKRVGNVADMLPVDWKPWAHNRRWPSNLRIGATFCNQEEVNRDMHKLLLLDCPNFASLEPLLGPITLAEVARRDRHDADWTYCDNALTGFMATKSGGWDGRRLEWVIVGGESGPGARPMHPNWVRLLRDECEAHKVPFHFKQWGEWAPSISGRVPLGSRLCRFTGGDVTVMPTDRLNVTYSFIGHPPGELHHHLISRTAIYEGIAMLPGGQVVLVETRGRQ